MEIDHLLDWTKDDRIHQLYRLWLSSRGSHIYPGQQDLDLMEVPRLVPDIFMIDAAGPDDFLYRFIGTRVDKAIGPSVTGKRISEYRSGRAKKEITDFFKRIREDGDAGAMRTRLPSETYDWMEYLRFGLPIADDHATPNKVIGMLLVETNENQLTNTQTMFEIEKDERGHVERHFANLPPSKTD